MGELKVMPKPTPRNDVEEVVEKLRGEHADDILVIYRTKTGPFEMLSNQGDLPKTMFLIEQFKAAVIARHAELRDSNNAS